MHDIGAMKIWNEIPKDIRQRLLDNVFCRKCGATSITNYSITEEAGNVVLTGKCEKCGGKVVRVID